MIDIELEDRRPTPRRGDKQWLPVRRRRKQSPVPPSNTHFDGHALTQRGDALFREIYERVREGDGGEH